jgi:hypothetical protein
VLCVSNVNEWLPIFKSKFSLQTLPLPTHLNINHTRKRFDLDGSGVLEMDEIEKLIREVMGVSKEELSDLNLKAFVSLVDTNHDGSVDFNEFTEFLGFKPHAKDEEEDEDDEDEEEYSGSEYEDDDDDEHVDEVEIQRQKSIGFASGTKK